jgi:hypothetical protein
MFPLFHSSSLNTCEDPNGTSSAVFFGMVCVSSCTPEDPEGQKCIFLFLYQINIEFIKVFRVFRVFRASPTYTKLENKKHGWRLPREGSSEFFGVYRFMTDARTIHETQTKLISRKNFSRRKKYELRENNFLRRA